MDIQHIPAREGVIKVLKHEFGVDHEATGTDFSNALGKLISKDLSQEDRNDCALLVNGVEMLLEKQTHYSNISVDIIVTMAQITGHSPKKIIAAISRNTAKLKVPALSWVNKSLRVADTVASHPKLASIGSVEKIDTIRRLDSERLETIAASGTLVDVEGLPLPVNETPAPELRKAVNDIIKGDKQQEQSQETQDQMDLRAFHRILQQLDILSKRAMKVIPEQHPQFDSISDKIEAIASQVQDLWIQLDVEAGALQARNSDTTKEMSSN